MLEESPLVFLVLGFRLKWFPALWTLSRGVCQDTTFNSNLAGVGRTRAVVGNALDGACALCAFWSNKLGFLLVHRGSSLLIVLIRHVWSCADNYLLEMTCTVLLVCTKPGALVEILARFWWGVQEAQRMGDGKAEGAGEGRGCVWRPLNPNHIFFFHSKTVPSVELSTSEPNGLLGRFPFLCFRTDTGVWILKPWAGHHHKGDGLLEKPLSTHVHQSSQRQQSFSGWHWVFITITKRTISIWP